jgi:5'-nucleotidase (lipoprotein e(P4) family)
MKWTITLVTLVLALNASAQDSTVHYSEESLKQLPVLWQQTAAEYRALCYQAFNTAKWRLTDMLKKKKSKERWAIVTDLDETILDNSYAEAELIKKDKTYNSPDWAYWVSKAAATEVPGAAKFLQWVHQQGISVFYISNRDTSQVNITITNLKKLNLPDADVAHTMFAKPSDSSSKETRRVAVMKKYKLVMLLGDNLNDFAKVFELQPIADRKVKTDDAMQDWGNKFIVLPNSTYGEWENALYNYKHIKDPVIRDGLRKAKLTGVGN